MSFKDTVLSLNPDRYYRMGETSGTTMIDETGESNVIYGNNVTLGSPSLLQDGDPNTSVTFTATTGIDLSSFANVSHDGSFAIIVKTTKTSNNYLVGKASINSSRILYIDSVGNLLMYEGSGTAKSAGNNVNTILNDGNPHIIIFRFMYTGTPSYYDNQVNIDGINYFFPQTAGVESTLLNSTAWFSDFTGTVDELVLFKRTISLFQASQLASAWLGSEIALDNYENKVLSLSPYTYYRFSETAGLTLSDSAGNDDKTLPVGNFNLVTPSLIPNHGGDDSAFEIQSPNTYIWNIKVASAGVIDHTIMYWYEPTTLEAFRMIDNNGIGQLDYNASGIPSGTHSSGLPTLVIGEKHFYCFVRNSVGNFKNYVDGVEVASYLNNVTTISSYNMISSSSNSGKGVYDEFAGFPSEISATDIGLLYKIGLGINTNPITYEQLVKFHLPEAYWRFGETSGTTAFDEMGNHNGAYLGGISLNQPSLLVGDADPSVDFDGNNSVVNNLSLPLMTNAMTICCLIKTNVATKQDITVNGAGGLKGLVFTGANLMWEDSTGNIIGAIPLSIDTTYHVAVSISGTNLQLYVDGVPDSSSTTARVIEPINIGYYVNCFDGIIDEVAIFSQALTNEQIAQLSSFAKDVKPYPAQVNAYSPLAYWRLGESTGTTANDDSGNANHGVYVGSPTLAQTGLIIGDPDKSVDFTPTNSKVTVSGITGVLNATVGMIIKSADVSTINDVFLSSAIEMYIDAGGEFIFSGGQSTGVLTSDNTQSHIIVTFTNNVLKLFINGRIKFTGTYSGTIDIQNFGYNATGDFKGIIDEVFILDQILTDREIESLYNTSNALDLKFITGTIVENLAVALWDICSYRLDTKELVATKTQGNGAFKLQMSSFNASRPQFVTVVPVQGDVWIKSTTVALNALVYPSNPETDPYYFKCIANGTTGVSEPTWTDTPASTVVDGTVTWELVERMVQPITHSPIMPL